MTTSAGFPRSARLLRPEQYAAALKGRRVARGPWLMVQAGYAQTATARLGLIVGKRQAPLAVSRVAIKRVVREAFRMQRLHLPAGDYVVRLHGRVSEISLTELKRQVRAEVDGHFVRVMRQRPTPQAASGDKK